MKPDQKKSNVEKGREYEQRAAQFLIDNGFEIIERNWTAGHKEIDLIARDDTTVIFVEVKASKSTNFGHPAERMNKKKRDNLIAAAEQYIIEKNLKGYDFRFDLICFYQGKLEYYHDAFQAE